MASDEEDEEVEDTTLAIQKYNSIPQGFLASDEEDEEMEDTT